MERQDERNDQLEQWLDEIEGEMVPLPPMLIGNVMRQVRPNIKPAPFRVTLLDFVLVLCAAAIFAVLWVAFTFVDGGFAATPVQIGLSVFAIEALILFAIYDTFIAS